LTEIANPYRPGEPVVDPAMLYGRQDAADWIERQIGSDAHSLILNAMPLIGKTSFINHAHTLFNLPAHHLRISLSEMSPPAIWSDESNLEPEASPINRVLHKATDQLLPQLLQTKLITPAQVEATVRSASALPRLFAHAGQRPNPERLVLYIDDLHALFTNDKALIASFLTSLMPVLDEYPRLHLVFSLNQDKLRQINHPLIDGAPTLNLGALPADASLSMVTRPVNDVLRFDYGVTKRIVEVNSHHPYYLTLFCYTLLNRQVHDGWVNQRDFDAALADILASPIEPFTEIWDGASWVERAVLTGMAAMQGRHGPMTHQEIIRFLQQHDKAVAPEVVIDSLTALAERGVLVPMGAVSYRFHVDLLRYWLREHTDLAEILSEVEWHRLAAQARARRAKASASSASSPAYRPRGDLPRRRRGFIWPVTIGLLALFCLLATGAVFATQYLELPLFFAAQPTATPTATPSQLEAVAPAATATTPASTEPMPTVTPTAALVVARSLPSITYMGKDIDQSWRVYVMSADSSDVTPLSPEGVDDTAPTWSPDGQRIAFVSQRDGNREIYIMDADGQNVANVTRHPADDWTPAWSPDGTQLAFASIRSGGWEIYVMDMACLSAPESCPDSLTQITGNGAGNISPVWSPDGARFAFNGKAAGNWDIYTMATNGIDVRQITTAPENDLAPAWSPDGTLLAFETNRDGNVEIYVVDANGGVALNITNLPLANDHGPTWSPDGQQIVFYSNREGNWDVFATTLDGQTVTNLTRTPSRDEQTPSWRP